MAVAVGVAVGSSVGLIVLVGPKVIIFTDGFDVGVKVGELVGETVTLVGLRLGIFTVGLCEGACVPGEEVVGLHVGDKVGFVVGPNVTGESVVGEQV